MCKPPANASACSAAEAEEAAVSDRQSKPTTTSSSLCLVLRVEGVWVFSASSPLPSEELFWRQMSAGCVAAAPASLRSTCVKVLVNRSSSLVTQHAAIDPWIVRVNTRTVARRRRLDERSGGMDGWPRTHFNIALFPANHQPHLSFHPIASFSAPKCSFCQSKPPSSLVW